MAYGQKLHTLSTPGCWGWARLRDQWASTQHQVTPKKMDIHTECFSLLVVQEVWTFSLVKTLS